MAIEEVKKYLFALGIRPEQVKEFDVSSATVALAAEALGVDGARIAKTLSFLADGGAVLVVAAGDARIDNPKFKAAFGTKAKMLSPEQAEELVGHRVGGVCPFAVKDGCKIFLDVSLKRFDVVYPAAGSANSAVEMTLSELERCTDFLGWVDVCKLPAAE